MVAAANLKGKGGRNGSSATPLPPPADPAPLFSAEALKMQRLMRVNPLPLLNPSSLGQWMDQFDAGMLRMLALLWSQMVRRDDTLVTVKPQLECTVAAQDFGVFPIKGADEKEAARHKVCVDYFFEHLRVTDAFDRNVRGDLDKLLEQMMESDSFLYAVHHFVWKPHPGKMLPVEGGDPVPALTALLEYVPLWFFENTTGQLRLLRDGGFGVNGEELDWDSEWMCTTGRGLMFAACICVTFKRFSFQDWVIFMERYAQGKVVIQTPSQRDEPAGKAAREIAEQFNQELAFIFYGSQPGVEKPISLLGPEGAVSVDIWERFLERQDRKMSSMYRGNDLSMMSRAGKNEKPAGASLQGDEGDDMEKGATRRVIGVINDSIVRKVIEFCCGAGVEPCVYFGLPDQDKEDTAEVRANAEFLVRHGGRVSLSDTAERLCIQLVPEGDDDDLLVAPAPPISNDEFGNPNEEINRTGNARPMTRAEKIADIEDFLSPYLTEFRAALADDLIPLRLAIEHVVTTPNSAMQRENILVLRSQLPWMLEQMNRAPRTAPVLADLMKKAMERGLTQRPQSS